jgi:gas vesicle protein
MNNFGKVFIAALAGVAAGTVIGILFAPDKGDKTREKIAGSAGKLVDNIKDKVSSGLDFINPSYSEKGSNGSSHKA